MPCTPNQQQSTPIATGCPIAIAVVSKKAGCCPEGLPPGPPNTVLGNAPDGNGYAWFLMHPPAHLVSEAAPFSWDDATQCGVIPLPGRLTNNGNGSFTFTPGDGSAPTTIQWTITNNDAPFSFNPATFTLNIPQAASLVQNPDGSFTFDPGDGTAPITIPLIVTNNAAPFSWNPATRSLNVPQTPTLVQNADGSFTFNRGDGSTPITVPLTLTNNAAPFSWDPLTRSANIPQSPRLTANPDGSFTFIPGDGSPSVTIPKDCCPTLTTNTDGSLSWTNGAGVTSIEGHPRLSVTFNDGGGNTFDSTLQMLNIDFPAIPPDVFLAGTSYDPTTHLLTLTMSNGATYTVDLADLAPVVTDGTTATGNGTTASPIHAGQLTQAGNTYTWTSATGATFTFTLHPAATLTNNPAPFSWNAATQTGNIPVASLTANGDGSFTYDPGDGSGLIILPADCCPTLTNNGDGTYTYNQNDGSTPITITTHPALTLTQTQTLAGNHHRATLDTSGQILNLPPLIMCHRRYDGPSQGPVNVPPNVWQTTPAMSSAPTVGVVLDTTASAGAPMASGTGITIVKDGYYEVYASTRFFPNPSGDGYVHAITVMKNGNPTTIGMTPTMAGENPTPHVHFPQRFAVGDTLGVSVRTNDPLGASHFSVDLVVEYKHD